MDNSVIIAIGAVVVVIAIAVVVFIKLRNRLSGSATLVEYDEPDGSIAIPITQLPATIHFEDGSLFEIKDTAVISRISELIPVATQTATRTIADNAQNALKGMELVKLDIPFSKLTKSKEVADAARGYVHGGRGVAAQANLTKVDMSKVAKTSAVANGVANVMNVGSLVVGQYYMTEISAKLETMSKSIDKINDFQDKEFKGRILSVITSAKVISKFSAEIIENDEPRLLKLSELDSVTRTAQDLLGQVNLTMSGIVGKSSSPDYKDYLTKVSDLAMLVVYQNALVAVLEEISRMRYLLGQGTISTELSYAAYNEYLGQAVLTRNSLVNWHDEQVTALKIDLGNERITKSGIEAVVAAIPAWLIDENFKSKDLKQGFAQEISKQTQSLAERAVEPKRIYDEDVEVVIRDGKYYYLHSTTTDVIEGDSDEL